MQARRDYSAMPGLTRETHEEAPKAIPVKLEDLETLETAGTTVQRVPFPVTCGYVRGIPTFFAQLKGGRRFGVTPVLPRNAAGEPVCPAANGEQGYLTLELSENAQFEWVGTKLQVSIRPVLADWEPIEA